MQREMFPLRASGGILKGLMKLFSGRLLSDEDEEIGKAR